MQPLGTVDDKGFRHLLHTIDPNMNHHLERPSPLITYQSYIRKKRKRLIGKVSSAPSFSITTDMWTSLANQAYMSDSSLY